MGQQMDPEAKQGQVCRWVGWIDSLHTLNTDMICCPGRPSLAALVGIWPDRDDSMAASGAGRLEKGAYLLFGLRTDYQYLSWEETEMDWRRRWQELRPKTGRGEELGFKEKRDRKRKQKIKI